MKKKTTFAQRIGNGLAHLQDVVDEVSDSLFKKMKQAGDTKTPKRKKDESKYAYGARKFGKRMMQFFGDMGESYYDTYETLKKKKEAPKD